MDFRFEEGKKKEKNSNTFLTRSGPVSVKMSSLELHVNDGKTESKRKKNERKYVDGRRHYLQKKKIFDRTLDVQDSQDLLMLKCRRSS